MFRSTNVPFDQCSFDESVFDESVFDESVVSLLVTPYKTQGNERWAYSTPRAQGKKTLTHLKGLSIKHINSAFINKAYPINISYCIERYSPLTPHLSPSIHP